jgi:hypothetical protein
MELLRSQSGDAVGVNLNAISFSALLSALRTLPDLKITKARQNPMNDEAFASFVYKGITFAIDTPISDYWIDKPDNCPDDIFDEIVQCLENYRVRWWHRIF